MISNLKFKRKLVKRKLSLNFAFQIQKLKKLLWNMQTKNLIKHLILLIEKLDNKDKMKLIKMFKNTLQKFSQNKQKQLVKFYIT